MNRILIHLEADPKPNTFDQITAYDAGVDKIIAYGGVQPEDVKRLIHGVIFTRGGEELENTAVFVGGENVAIAEKLMDEVHETFFDDFRVSSMIDPNGANTTSAAMVHKIAKGRTLTGKKALILAGTGPLGMRTAVLLAKEGCEVFLSSRRLDRAEQAAKHVMKNHRTKVTPLQLVEQEDIKKVLDDGINIVSACGAAGIQLLDKATWLSSGDLEVLADVNAVAPLGIEGIDMEDNGIMLDGKCLYGPIAIGNLKMKVHRGAVRALFRSKRNILDLESIYDIAKELGK